MRIYTMTATFGKLSGQTLKLKPGLNIIEAPNEWGKSTWCAFLIAMLYGLDTASRSGKNRLADREHYAPWSGEPMSGRIDLQWNGRDITLERSTRGRMLFGTFRAYETHTGLPVPELTGENCGSMLTGVERSVYVRTGFIRFSDLPVTQDEALRQRLNALVTTGDESETGKILEGKLKELRNRCRYHRTGLLPEAEQQRELLEEKLRQITALQALEGKLESRQQEQEVLLTALRNHRDALAYEKYRACCRRWEEACARREKLQSRLHILEEKRASCGREHTASDLQAEQARRDAETWAALKAEERRESPLLWICGLLLMTGGAVLLVLHKPVIAAVLAISGAGLTAGGLALQILRKRRNRRLREKLKNLEQRYGNPAPECWENMVRQQSEQTREALQLREQCEDLQLRLRETQELICLLQSACSRQVPPKAPDNLALSEAETAAALEEAAAAQKQLRQQLGQCQGKMSLLGQPEVLQKQLEQADNRISELERLYQALDLALKTHAEASAALQRRFAPRISRRAQSLLSQMTEGRYERIILGEDLLASTGARGETTTRCVLWRSDGTADQMYLAVRLAAAEALIPQAPLVLDDALVRFDDTRLRKAMEILRQEAESRQVILFTCQGRESRPEA